MDVPGCQTGLFVKLHGAVVAAPDIQGQKLAADFFRISHGIVVEGGADVLPPAVLVHTEVIDIQLLPVGQDGAVRKLANLAETVTGDEAVLVINKNGGVFVLQQCFQLFRGIFDGIFPENVRTDVMVDTAHLI